MSTTDILAQFPPKCAPLFERFRYKVMYGGRGSGKSWAAARALLLMGQQRQMRILGCRELMVSMADSVHQLFTQQIQKLHLNQFYRIEQKTIYGHNGTEIRFAGLKNNVSGIRSFEGIDVAWVEEGQTVSKSSWETLIPTVRSPNSEIWVTMNPILETDNSYQRFIANPPKNSWVQKLNWQDNPWFPAELREDLLEMKLRHYQDYMHIYEGECRQFLEGAVYLHEILAAEEEGRITEVRYDPNAAVDVFFDLGWGDATAMWLCQRIPGGETHFIEYYEDNRKPLDHYLKYLSDKSYPINNLYLPWDGAAKSIGTGKSIEELIRSKGFRVKIVPKLSISDGINALRTLFPNLWIDKENCEEGLQALRHYRFELIKDGEGGFKNDPVHDRWSHGADAARYAAIALRQPKAKDSKYDLLKPQFGGTHTSWMNL